MLGVVTVAIVGGALTGWARSLANSIGMCVVLATLLACGVMALLRSAQMEEGRLILSVAAFMFAWVISTAFSLMVRRVLAQRART